MNYPSYKYVTEESYFSFEFVSVGVKGKIKKVVQYTEMSVKGFYNLGFGDYNEETKEIDDEVVTNNGDGLKVLATVVSTLYAFTGKNPVQGFLPQAVVKQEQGCIVWVFLIT